MVRRKPIGIGSRLGNNSPSLLDSIVKYEDMAKQAEVIRAAQAEQAYASYNAGLYPYRQPDNSFIINPIVFPIQEETPVRQSKKYNGNRSQFINNIYNAYNKSLLRRGSTPEEANRLATMLTEQSAMETGYGSHVAANHNYGGHRVNGKYINYSSDDAYADAHINLLDRKWQGWRTAKNEEEFGRAIHAGKQKYSEIDGSDYGRRMKGTSNNIYNTLTMNKRKLRYGGQVKRPKAFLGAVIGAFGSIANSLIQGSQQEEMMKKQQEAEDRRYYSQLASNMSSVLNNRAAQEAYENQYRMAYSNGGRRRLRHGVNITDGGYAIPMGNNTFLLRGGSHEDINETGQTGIGININGKEIEGENGEVVQKKPNEVRIFSDTIGINGNTFADLVRMGYDKDELFKIQQIMNGDYGRRTMRNGGHLTRPVERIRAKGGIRVVNGRRQRFIPAQNGNAAYWLDEGPVDNRGFFTKVSDWITKQLNSTPKAGSPKKTTTGTRALNFSAQTGPFYSSNTPNNFNNESTNNTRITDLDNVGTYKVNNSSNVLVNYNTGRRTQNINNTPVQTSWIGRDGRQYYGTITRGSNGNTYKIDKIEQALSHNSNTRGVVSSGTSKSNMFLNTPNVSVVTNESTGTPASTGSTGTKSPRGARVGSTGSNRTLASRGASPSRTTQSIPGIQFVAPDIDNTTPTTISPFAIMQNNGLNETGRNIIAPIAQSTNTTPNSTAYDEVYKTNPWGMTTRGADWIQLGADTVGSLVSGLVNLNTANNVVMPREPAPIQAVKLPTTYSIGSDLAANERSRGMMLSDARRNTSSSAGLASRRNLINLTASDNVSKLYQTRSREENNMLAADARNQQDVAIRNAMIDADYQARLNEMQNRQAMLRGNAYSTMLSGLSDAVGNFIDQGKQRYSDEQAMRYYMALLPEEGREYIRRYLRKGGRV